MRSLLVHSNYYKEITFFFIQYKNEWKERKFRTQNNKNKNEFYKSKKVLEWSLSDESDNDCNNETESEDDNDEYH